MSEADAMFEELGYEKRENNLEIKYIKNDVAMGEKFYFEIMFVKVSKLVKSKQLLTPYELKAITKKCEELGWL